MTTTDNTDHPTFDQRLQALVAPVQKELDDLNLAQLNLEIELAQLKDTRKRLEAVLYAADPTLKPRRRGRKPGPSPGTRRGTPTLSGAGVSQDKVEKVRQVIQENMEGQQLSRNSVVKAYELTRGPIGIDTVRKALLELHAQGYLTLAGTGMGGGRLYRIAAEGQA